MTKRRILSMLLALLILASGMVSCAENTTEETKAAGSNDTQAVAGETEALEAEKNMDKYLDFSAVRAAMNAIDWNIKITEQEKVDIMSGRRIEK